MNQPIHKPDCASKRQCLVYHGEGVSCPNPYPCDCGYDQAVIESGKTHFVGDYCVPAHPPISEKGGAEVKKEKRCPECQVDQPETYGHTMTCSKREDPMEKLKKIMKPQPKEDWTVEFDVLGRTSAEWDGDYIGNESAKSFISDLLSRQRKEILESLLEKMPKKVKNDGIFNQFDKPYEAYEKGGNEGWNQYRSEVEKIINEEMK